MDYGSIRKRLAIGDPSSSSTVSVNHRALITRTLTKYPVDYALYRELLQNSADARAEKVVISFQTARTNPALPLLSEHNIRELHTRPVGRLVVKNDGELFKDDDWNRLREIARGNPNESKIGAFGVGFYSVFELTDEPLVHSGDTVTSFYYVGDQLHFVKNIVPAEDFSKWTVIDLPYRAYGVLPDLVPFTAFLTQSFMLVPLVTIELEIDGLTLLKLNKVVSPEQPLEVPRHVNGRSPNGFLDLRKVKSEAFQVTVEYMNITQRENVSQSGLLGFGRKLFAALTTTGEAPMEMTSVTCFLRKVTGEIDVRLSNQFASKMKETLMKPPPETAIISMLAYSNNEKSLSELKPPLSEYIFPKDFNDAKIFIGFPTKQSTSMLSHLAMNQLIPTMERTAIDMSNKFVKDWNEQMLYTGGVISRVVYEHEMAAIHEDMISEEAKIAPGGDEASMPGKFPGESPIAPTKSLEAACHIMGMFEMKRSAPDATVGEWIALGFWKCSKLLSVPTQQGIRLSREARVARNAPFIRHTPVLPGQVLERCDKFIERALSLDMLRELSPADVLHELNQSVITPDQMLGLLTWIKSQKLDKSAVQKLLDAAVVSLDGRTLCLGSIKTFQYRKIGPGLPIPDSCLPLELTEMFSPTDLGDLGWRELGVRRWVEFLAKNIAVLPEEHNITLSKEFANTVLTRVGEAWSSLNSDDARCIYSCLNEVACIPTQLGMKYAKEAYMMPIPLFPNLPVKAHDLAANYNFLVAIGLRETVEMALVLRLLQNPEESNFKWSTVDLVRYMTKNVNALKSSDWVVLRGEGVFESTENKRCMASDLFAPDKSLEKLGFPVLKWDETWDPMSKEASLLARVGLRSYPTEAELFEKAYLSKSEQSMDLAIRYYLKNFDTNEYSSKKTAGLQYKIIASTVNGHLQRCAPGECYYDEGIGRFGFAVVVPAFRQEAAKLGVEKAPSIQKTLLEVTRNPPRSRSDAQFKFTYLSTRIGEISRSDVDAFSSKMFIPIFHKAEFVKHQCPQRTFLEAAEDVNSKTSFAKAFFDFISMPPPASIFLQTMGVRQQPTIIEMVRVCISEPKMMYQLAASPLVYEDLISEFATNWSLIKKDKNLVSKMERSRFLLATAVDKAEDDSSASDKTTYSLASASEIVIADDIINYNIFKYHLKTAPQVEGLELFYRSLGSPLLSTIVSEETSIYGPLSDEAYCESLKKRITERVNLFIESSHQPVAISASKLKLLHVHLVTSITLVRRIHMRRVVSPDVREHISACFDPRKPDDLSLFVARDSLDWFDVSKAFVKRILKRPNPDAVIVLELQLKSDLTSLQNKGYNVNRLLKNLERERQKQREDQEKVAREQMEAQRLLEEQRLQELRSQEGLLADQRAKRATQPDLKAPIHPTPPQQPNSGAHSSEPIDVPENRPPIPHQQSLSTNSRGLWDNIRKGFGTRTKGYQERPTSVDKITEPSPAPRPTPGQNNARGPLVDGGILQNGIRKVQAFGGNELQAHINGDRQPNMNDPRMQPRQVLCDPDQVHDLKLAATTQSGLKCYVSNDLTGLTQAELAEAARFETILRACSKIYDCAFMSFHIFLDSNGRTIAFNSNGSLFFNLRYFLGSMRGPPRLPGSKWNPSEALDFWFPVVAHELSHNLFSAHGQDHSHATESYVQYYLQKYKQISGSLSATHNY